jgi:GT2 family glycosyltransferase
MIAAVVIGRNEVGHLGEALSSARSIGGPIVYVDSDSSDGSVAAAKAAGVATIELAPPGLSAARGRNAGLAWLVEHFPEAEFVVFLDGDCVLHADFAWHAASALEADARVAIVVGHLHERSPATTVYSRLSALEWSSETGEIRDFGNLGGIMCARVSAIRAIGGFNAGMIAGEDSELGVRLALAGHRIVKIDSEMATHDNGISSFGPWWRRAVRAGHALAQRYMLNGKSAIQDCKREFFSTLFWGIGLPAAALVLAWPTQGWSLALALGYPLLAFRMATRGIAAGRRISDAVAAACFGIAAKFANAVGVVKYFRNALSGEYRIIEYKGPVGGAAD